MVNRKDDSLSYWGFRMAGQESDSVVKKNRAPLSATARAERARATALAATARELLYAGIIARLWHSYISDVVNTDFPFLLCVDSPAGLLTWRLTNEESEMFDWVERGATHLKRAIDRTPILHALAANGWETQ